MPKMNVARMNALAAYLETLPRKRFNITSWFSYAIRGTFLYPFNKLDRSNSEVRHSCNTAACVAGHTVLLFAPQEKFNDILDNPSKFARRALGLTAKQADDLFIAHWEKLDGDLANNVKPGEAAAYIRKMVAANAYA